MEDDVVYLSFKTEEVSALRCKLYDLSIPRLITMPHLESLFLAPSQAMLYMS